MRSFDQAPTSAVSAGVRRGCFLFTFLVGAVLSGLAVGCGSGVAPAISTENESATPAADPIGERLFLDTRFAKFFFEHMTGYNAALTAGDPWWRR